MTGEQAAALEMLTRHLGEFEDVHTPPQKGRRDTRPHSSDPNASY